MTLTDYVFAAGLGFFVVVVLFLAALVIWKRITPAGSEQVPDNAEHVIDDRPPPTYPKGADS